MSHSKKEEREYVAAKNSAAGSLSLRPHSRKELDVKLKDKGYSADAIGKALDRLQELVALTPSDCTCTLYMQNILTTVTRVMSACCGCTCVGYNHPQQSRSPFTAGIAKRCRLC